MEFLIDTFNTFLYQPLFNILMVFYTYTGRDFGVAIILLTILIKVLFYPLGAKAIRSQKALSEMQPKVKEVQEKYKDNKEEQVKQIMALYKEEKINPFSGCLPMLIQLPFLIALYQVFWRGIAADQLVFLYAFVPNPGALDSMFFNFLDLSKASFALALIAGILQFVQTRMVMPKHTSQPGKKPDMSIMMQKQMQYLFPIFTVIILLRIPSAVGLYWITNTVFSIGQQYLVFRKMKAAKAIGNT